MEKSENDLRDTILKLGPPIGNGPGIKEGPLPCEPQWAASSIKLQKPDNVTPYPALVASYSLAAVDSPEAGILFLSDWIKYTEKSISPDPIKSLAQRWYLIRAKVDLGLIATASIRSLIATDRLIAFERQLTDDFASILGVGSADSWKRLCKQLEKDTLHNRVGRWLAFNYASARGYLFELQTPSVFQTWRGERDQTLTGHSQEDLDEAIVLAASEDCFGETPGFQAYRWQWIGQFQLNVAQLRLARLVTLPEADRPAELTRISRLLDVAADHLVASPSDGNSVADNLLGSDPFDDQRIRVAALRSYLAQNRPQE
jgi:hypothetical protein